jgi:hypothetical protein
MRGIRHPLMDMVCEIRDSIDFPPIRLNIFLIVLPVMMIIRKLAQVIALAV